MIKGKVIFAALMALVSLSGCDKVDDLLVFTISDQTVLTIESASPLDLPFEIPTPDITTNSSQEFENNDTRTDLVKDIKLEEIVLTITNPSGKNFSFLKAIYVYVSTDETNEILLASLDNISASINTIVLVPTAEKLDQYVKASSYKLSTSVVTRETLTQNIDVQVNLKFKVTAEAL